MKRSMFIFALFILLAANTANAQELPKEPTTKEPTIGQITKVRVPVCRIDVRWNRSSGINNVYAPPAGWQILEFNPIVISKRQYAKYSFDQTPSSFALKGTTSIDAKFDELLQVTAQNGKQEKYEGKIKQARNDYEKYYKKIVATHSSIQTTGSVRGDNNTFKRRPGRLYLDLEVTLVYAPVTDEQFQQSIEFLKAMIKDDATSVSKLP